MNETASHAPERFEWLAAAGMLLFLVLSAALSIWMVRPPRVVPASAPATEFSAERALAHLQVIAAAPHPIGSPEHDRVRDYLLRELTALGVDPNVQQAPAPFVFGLPTAGVVVQNIFAKVKGSSERKAVLLAAHYDSRPRAPGAADDGAAVSALLETVRALRSGPPLENATLVLITDGEEAGLLGARAFVRQAEHIENVALVMNFEARGSHGPSFMFQTSPDNGWLIREFAKAAPRPFASSFSYEVYKRMPNDTDFTVFKDAGLPGLNFAFFEGLTRYHTPQDKVANLDLRSLQHHGSYALALTRHFGRLDLEHCRADDLIYFDVLGSTMFFYPLSWALPMGVASALGGVGVFVWAIRRGLLKLRGLMWGCLAFFCTLVAAPAAVWLVWWPIGRLHSRLGTLVHGDTHNAHFYTAAFTALTLCVTTTMYAWFRKRLNVQDLAAGSLLVWLCLTVIVCVCVPGGSYLFMWPLVFGLLGASPLLFMSGNSPIPRGQAVTFAITAFPTIVLFVPLIYLLFAIVGISKAWGVVVCESLVLGLLVPHLEIVLRPCKWLLAGLSAIVCLGLLAAGILTASSQ